MTDKNKTKKQLINELAEMRQRIAELEAGAAESKSGELIAERQKTEKTLLQREQGFKTLVENNPDMIVRLDRAYRHVYINPAVEKELGLPTPEVLGKTHRELGMSAEAADWLERVIRRVFESGQESVFEAVIPIEGDVKHYLTRGVPEFSEDGSVASMLFILRNVTERVQAEEAYRTLVEHSLQGLLIIQDGRIVFANPGIADLSGYTSEELCSLSWDDLQAVVHPEDREWIGRNLQDRVAGKPVPPRYELRFIRRDGEVRWVEALVTRVDYRHKPAVQVACVDITERKRAETALQESEERYRLLLESISDSVYVLDREWRHLIVNDAAERFVQIPKEDLLGAKLTDLFPGVEETMFFKVFQGVMETRQPDTVVDEYTFEDGRQGWYEVRVYPVPEGILCISRDITKRKRAEKALQRRNRELALLNRVITASAASFELNAILETICRELALAFEVPQAAAFLLNEEKTEASVVAEFLTNDRPSVLNEVMPVTGNPVAQHLLTHKTPLVVKDAQSDPRLALIRDLLRRRGTVSFLIIPLIVEEEGVGAFSLAATQPRDFSEQEVDLACNVAKQVAGALGRIRLEEAHQRLVVQYHQAQKMDAIGQLVGGITHDFKNLLMAINGFAELIQSRSELDAGQREMVGYILSSGQRAADLIHRLLAFSRKQIVEPKVLVLNTLVANLNKMLRRIIGEDIQIETVLAPDLWPVKTDPAQLEQVIINLAVNARDAMPDGGQLTLETANVVLDEAYTRQHFDVQPGAYVMLVVSDTGVGMNEDTKARIFEPFFTTKAQGQGTGLGLATVYGIVKQNQGYIWVYSEEGQGTTFKIYLPRTEETVSPLTRAEVKAEMPDGDETILLVEDDARVRELAQTVLEEQGYTVLEAEDGQEALRLAADHTGPIHLLLSDVIMPGMSGQAVTRQLSRTHPDLKILFMSGHSDETIAHHGALDPGVAFLPKPFNPTVLARKVREVLDE